MLVCVLPQARPIGGYMALNIGANDVANNMGPAVGSKVLSVLTEAVLIAAVFESAGSLLSRRWRRGEDLSRCFIGDHHVPLRPQRRRIALRFPQPDAWCASCRRFVCWRLATYLNGAGLRAGGVKAARHIPLWITNVLDVIGGRHCRRRVRLGELGHAVEDCSKLGYFILYSGSALFAAIGIVFLIEIKIMRASDRNLAARKWVPILIGLATWLGAFMAYMAMNRFPSGCSAPSKDASPREAGHDDHRHSFHSRPCRGLGGIGPLCCRPRRKDRQSEKGHLHAVQPASHHGRGASLFRAWRQ